MTTTTLSLFPFHPSHVRQISAPSSNWLALQKSLVRHSHPRKRPKVDGTPSSNTRLLSPRATSPPPPLIRHRSDGGNGHVDLETTEIKNGESIASLRRMVLGRVQYTTSQSTPGKYLALDCEMVGIGIDGNESSLARVSLVNYAGAVVLDAFVKQRERVVDYRTQWSGIRRTDLAASAKPFKEVQQTVANLIKDRVLVGHAIHNDLKALLLSHPSPQIRDTQLLAYKHRVVKSRHPALRVLVKQELGLVIQSGEHSSVTDARATMALFRLYKKQWESGFRPLRTPARSQSKNGTDEGAASKASALGSLSPSSTPFPAQGQKRKRSDSGEGVVTEASSSSPPTKTSPPLPSSKTSSQAPRGRGGKSKPPADSVQQKGISSGISTVSKRAGGVKEIQGKGTRTKDDGKRGGTVVNSNSKGVKKPGKVGGEKWWKSLGGGKKGSTKL